MDIRNFLQNWIVRNILWAIALVVGIVIVSSVLIAVVTQHSRKVTVPDFTNMTLEQAQQEATSAGISVYVIDSVFIRRMQKGVVYSQHPKAGSEVKRGRKIMLTTNATMAKKVTMPNLVGLSMRQAKAELSSKGLFLGKLIYMNDIATNNVLQQIFRNRQIPSGTSVESGSVIDLVVGLDVADSLAVVPDLKGIKYQRSVDMIQENSLNVAKTVFDESVKDFNDSINAFVYKQGPGPQANVYKGDGVTIFLTTDKSKLD